MMQQSKARFGTEGDGWFSHDGRLWLDALPCMSSQGIIISRFYLLS